MANQGHIMTSNNFYQSGQQSQAMAVGETRVKAAGSLCLIPLSQKTLTV